MLQDISMKSLQAKIADDEQLIALVAHVWGVAPTSFTLTQLIALMQNPFAARSVWLQLDEAERLCLFHTLGTSARSKGIPLDSLRKKVKLPISTVEAAASRLKDHWMLIDEDEVVQPRGRTLGQQPETSRGIFPFRECSDVLWSTGQELFKPYADRSEMSLSHLLGTFSGNDLQNLARRCYVSVQTNTPTYSSYRGLAPSNRHPFDVQEQVVEALQQPFIVFEIQRRLDATALHLFLWLCCERGGKATMAEVRTFLHCDEKRLFEVLHLLEMHALAFDSLTVEASRRVSVPQEVLSAVKQYISQLADDERTYAFLPSATLPPIVREGQPLISYDLAVVVGAVHHIALEPTKDNRLMKRQSAKLRPLLHGQPRLTDETHDDLYPDMVMAAARHFEVIQRIRPFEDAKLRYAPGPKLSTSWSQISLVEQIRRFLAWWGNSTEWVDTMTGESSSASYTGRKQLLELLRSCVPGKYYTVESLLYALWKVQPLELNERGYQKPPASGGSPLHARWKKWRKMYGARYLAMLASTLHEAGLVSMGYAHAPGGDGDTFPTTFLVTDLGAAVLAEAADVNDGGSPVDGPSLIVQPSFEVIALCMDPALIYELIAFADILWLERVSRFKITKNSLLHGLATGRRVEEIIVFLQRHSQVEVAQNVERTLLDWSKGYQEACLSEMMLIDVSNQDAAKTVQRALEARAVPIRQLSSCVIAVSLQAISRGDLYKLLEKTGVVVRETVAL